MCAQLKKNNKFKVRYLPPPLIKNNKLTPTSSTFQGLSWLHLYTLLKGLFVLSVRDHPLSKCVTMICPSFCQWTFSWTSRFSLRWIILPCDFCICPLAHICKSFLWESFLQEFSNWWLEFLGLGACTQSSLLGDITVLFKGVVPIHVPIGNVMTSPIAPYPCLHQLLSAFLIIHSPKLYLSM